MNSQFSQVMHPHPSIIAVNMHSALIIVEPSLCGLAGLFRVIGDSLDCPENVFIWILLLLCWGETPQWLLTLPQHCYGYHLGWREQSREDIAAHNHSTSDGQEFMTSYSPDDTQNNTCPVYVRGRCCWVAIKWTVVWHLDSSG